MDSWWEWSGRISRFVFFFCISPFTIVCNPGSTSSHDRWTSTLGQTWAYGSGVIDVEDSASLTGRTFSDPAYQGDNVVWEQVVRFGRVVAGAGWHFGPNDLLPIKGGES